MVSESQTADGASIGSSRRKLAVRGSIFELTGFGASQVVRLGGNLILTRLLFPEAFGLAALVNIALQGLELLSDVGFGQSIVQNKRGEDPVFLNTAWTLQILRGVILSVLCLLLAHPFSLLYEEPILKWLLVVGAGQSLLQGFLSTSLSTLRRRVHVGLLSLLELAAQLVCVVVMIIWVQFDASVWALIGGGAVRVIFRVVCSHLIPVGYRNRFQIDRECRDEILRFGRWILGSTALFFVSRQADRLIVGKLLGVGVLGVYSIAVMLADLVDTVLGRVTDNVLFPIFSQAAKEGVPQLRRVYYRARLRIDALFVTGMGALAVGGSLLVDLVWDDRYSGAGWMFEILCVRVAMSVMVYPCDRCLLAMGEGSYPFYRSLVRSIWVVVGVPLGFAYAGIEGLITASALAEVPVFFVLWPAFYRRGMLRLHRELVAPACFGIGFAAALAVEPWLAAWVA